MPEHVPRRLRLLVPAATLAAAVALGGPGPAGAVDDTAPSPTCAPSAKDNAGDSAHPQTGDTSDNLEIVGAFLKHDPAKGDEATTINIAVKDLGTALPQGTTSMHWAAEWGVGSATFFVRALVDYTGTVVFEHGERIPETAAGNLPRYEYRGDTTGKLFEGPNGIVQIVIPPDIGGKAGTVQKATLVSANGGYQVVPAAATTPTRGVSYAWDEATVKGWTVGGCAAETAPPPPAVPDPVPSPGPSEQGGAASLPVKLVTTRVPARKAKRKLKLRLRSSEKVTRVVARLRKGRKVVARGRLGKLSGTGTLTLKVSRRLRKGTYVLDLAGRDASGRQRTAAAKLRLR